MPRGIWSGSLSFGLVNVPVELVTAVRDRGIHLREVHATRRVPLRRKRMCTLEEVEVPIQEIAHGLDLDGQRVMLTDEELAAVQPRTTKTIEISGFVHEGEVDPVFYDRSYWLATRGEEEGPVRAYRLLVDAMHRGGHVGLGALVIHSREHPVAIRAREGRLLLSTMLFSHEIRSLDDLDGLPDPALADAEAVRSAVAIVGELATDFEPTRYHDRNRRRLQAVIERKVKGEEIPPAPEPAAPKAAPDLMAALERSLETVRKSGYTTERVGKRSPPSAEPSRERGAGPRGSRRAR